jgi:hypothetical protein
MATKTLSNDLWQKVRDNFKIFTHTRYAYFLVDGFKVHITCEYVTHNKLSLSCYVNGEFKGAWFSIKEPTEITTRFFPYDFKPVYASRTKTVIKELYKTKKAIIERYPNYDSTVKVPRFYYHSIAEVQRVLEANNESIELLELNGEIYAS